MLRRKFLKSTGLTLAGFPLLNSTALAAFMRMADGNIQMLTPKIGMYTEKGGTILFMLSEEGNIIVDTQFPESAGNLILELKKKTELPYRLIINTHHHGDHTSGNIVFKDLAPHILAHENSKINQESAARKQQTESKQAYPNQTYKDTWCEKLKDEQICMHYFGAAHTNGDSLVHFQESDILHLGDLVFNRRHPYIDKTAGADISNWIKVLDKAVGQFSTKTKYICGHAEQGYQTLITSDDLKFFGQYLHNLLVFVEKEIKMGKSKDEILKATYIPGSPEWTGSGIERPLTAAYSELAQ